MRRRSAFGVLVIAGATGLVLVACPRTALAVPRFPDNIRSDLSLDYAPPCRLCHIGGTTGSGSVATPFGVSMLARGMTGDRSMLAPALAALTANDVDSDGDGVSDISELKANTDPNTPVDVPLSPGDPTYGCAIAATGRREQTPRSALLIVGIGILVLGLRRPRPFSPG